VLSLEHEGQCKTANGTSIKFMQDLRGQFVPQRNFRLESYMLFRLNNCFKQKETPETGYLVSPDSSSLSFY
jgi:hypothetical protein